MDISISKGSFALLPFPSSYKKSLSIIETRDCETRHTDIQNISLYHRKNRWSYSPACLLDRLARQDLLASCARHFAHSFLALAAHTTLPVSRRLSLSTARSRDRLGLICTLAVSVRSVNSSTAHSTRQYIFRGVRPLWNKKAFPTRFTPSSIFSTYRSQLL